MHELFIKYDSLEGIVLWTNPNPNSAFSAQTITLSDNVENFKRVECLFKSSKNTSGLVSVFTTGKLPIPCGFIYSGFYCYNSSRGTGLISSGNKITFTNATMQTAFGSETTTNNDWAIPVKIIGYK